jgi:hypothetical protein
MSIFLQAGLICTSTEILIPPQSSLVSNAKCLREVLSNVDTFTSCKMDKKDANKSGDGSLQGGTDISQQDVNKTLDTGCNLNEEAEQKKRFQVYDPFSTYTSPVPVQDGASTPQASQQLPGELLRSPDLLFFNSLQEGCDNDDDDNTNVDVWKTREVQVANL